MMQTTTHKRLPIRLVGMDGNAFSIIAALTKAARRANWTNTEIDDMTNLLKAADYDNLVAVAMEYCE